MVAGGSFETWPFEIARSRSDWSYREINLSIALWL